MNYPQDLEKAIMSLKNSKAAGMGNIQSELLKNGGNIMIHKMTALYGKHRKFHYNGRMVHYCQSLRREISLIAIFGEV